ncbi:MFS transporter [Microbacterium sp. K24]|uniref:MFS transporter n=1 Tax=Microbacterium sp. K24 TaxID=2305446 RepID=UPI001443ED6B|nr:MFS transporter [Microbacterium sp. K24]
MPTLATPSTASSIRSKLLLPVLLLGVFVMPISITGAAIALPEISQDLGNDPFTLQGVVNGFNIALTISTLMWGQLGNRIGLRRTFVVGLATVAAGAAASALATDLITLDIARIISGVGAAAIATGATSIISHAYSGARRAAAFSLLGTVVGIGLAAGPLISGLLVSFLGWRGIFGVIVALSALTLVATAFRVLPALAQQHEDSAPRRKLFDLAPLQSSRFLSIALVPVAASVAYVSVLTYAPVAFSAVYGQDAAAAGMFMLPLTLPVLVGPALAGLLITKTRVTAQSVLFTALLLLVLGDLMFLLFAPVLSPLLLIIPMVLLGFGWGLPLGLVDGEALASVRHRSAAAAAGILNFLRLGSEAVAVAAFGAAIAAILSVTLGDPTVAAEVSAGGEGHADAYADAFRMMMLACAIITAGIGLAVVMLSRRGAVISDHVQAGARTPESTAGEV